MNTLSEIHKWLWINYFRPFQRDIIRACLTNSKVAVLGSRQIGKTIALTYVAVLMGLGTKDVPGHNVLVISENEAKAKKLIRDVNEHLDKLERFLGPLREPNRGGTLEVVLYNGSTISAKPGKPSALQMFSGTVIVDELSLTQHDSEELYGQALIVASAKPYFKTIVCTNSDSEGSFVHNLFRSPEPSWVERRKDISMLEYNVYDVWEELPEKLIQIKNTIHPKLWRRFYLNEFLTGNIGYYDPALIEQAKHTSIPQKDPLTVLAYDPGFSRDGSGIVVANVTDKIVVLEEHLLFNMEIDRQLEFIDTLVKRHQVGCIAFDQGVGGIVVGQQLKRLYGALVKPVSINRNFYQTASAELERLLWENKIHIPSTCHNVIEDLKAFEKTDRGLFNVPHRLTRSGKTHCDCGVSLLMSLAYLQKKAITIDVQTFDLTHNHGLFI